MRRKLFWLALALELLLMALLSRSSDFAVHGNSLVFVSVFLAAGCLYLVAVMCFAENAKVISPKVFWVAAIALRLAVLPMSPADDFWRYLWEGEIQRHGFNPYLHSPQSETLIPMRDEIWPRINHSEWAAIYPPGAEWMFAQMARISMQPLFFKLAFTLADLGVVYLLLRLNTGPGRYRTTAWYAWNPLVVCSFAGAGHFDSVMLLALIGAAWALHRANPLDQQAPAWSWSVTSALFLGLAISLKTMPVFLLPVWTFALGSRCFVLSLSMAIPWLLSLGYGGVSVVSDSLRKFADVTRFNDVLWWFTEKTIWSNPAQKNGVYLLILCIATIVAALVCRRDWRRGALWVLGAVLVFSPALHPWYVTWILPFACWRAMRNMHEARPWFVLSISVAVCLLVWENGWFWQAWKMNTALHLLVIVPPLLAFCKFGVRKAEIPGI